MAEKPSTATEYLQGLGPSEKLITLERGMKILIRKLPDDAMMELFQTIGIRPEKQMKKEEVFKTMKPEQIVKLLQITACRGAKNPKIALVAPGAKIPDGAINYSDLLYIDKFKIMGEVLEISGLGEEATQAREKFRE